MYKRFTFPEDPWVSIMDYKTTQQFVYAENSNRFNTKILETEGGMDVFIRKNN